MAYLAKLTPETAATRLRHLLHVIQRGDTALAKLARQRPEDPPSLLDALEHGRTQAARDRALRQARRLVVDRYLFLRTVAPEEPWMEAEVRDSGIAVTTASHLPLLASQIAAAIHNAAETGGATDSAMSEVLDLDTGEVIAWQREDHPPFTIVLRTSAGDVRYSRTASADT